MHIDPAKSPRCDSEQRQDLDRLQRFLARAPEEEFAALKSAFHRAMDAASSMAEAMQAARAFKMDVALLTALADLTDVWPVLTVTGALTDTADAALQGSVRFLFRQAVQRGDWIGEADDAAPESQSGFIVLSGLNAPV